MVYVVMKRDMMNIIECIEVGICVIPNLPPKYYYNKKVKRLQKKKNHSHNHKKTSIVNKIRNEKVK